MKIKTPTFACIAIALCLNISATGTSETLAERLEQTRKNWRSITPEMLQNPANADLLLALRTEAADAHAVEARVLLLNLQDPSTVQACLADLHREGSWDRGLAAQAFSLSSQPRLILALMEDLHRDESAKKKRVPAGEEVFRITPVSVLAARAIKQIIMNCPEFNSKVKTWASAIPAGPGSEAENEAARAQVRKWVKRNEALLRANRYHLVEPQRD